MARTKTKPTGASIEDYLAARGSEQQRANCHELIPIRGRELVIYLIPDASLLSRLGPHKMGKSCMYFKRLADLDRPVLEKLVAGSVAETRRRHGQGRGA